VEGACSVRSGAFRLFVGVTARKASVLLRHIGVVPRGMCKCCAGALPAQLDRRGFLASLGSRWRCSARGVQVLRWGPSGVTRPARFPRFARVLRLPRCDCLRRATPSAARSLFSSPHHRPQHQVNLRTNPHRARSRLLPRITRRYRNFDRRHTLNALPASDGIHPSLIGSTHAT